MLPEADADPVEEPVAVPSDVTEPTVDSYSGGPREVNAPFAGCGDISGGDRRSYTTSLCENNNSN